MHDLIKTGSLVGNILLVLLLSLTFLWMQKIRHELSREQERERELTGALTGHYEDFILSRLVSDRHLGMAFPRLEMTSVDGRTMSTDFAETAGGLVLLFDARGCQPCLLTQLKLLNQVHATLADAGAFQIMVITANTSPGALRRYRLKFDFDYSLIADTGKRIFSEENRLLYENVPVVLLIDENNTIIRSHVPLTNLPHVSALFFNEIQSVLPLAKPLFDGLFTNLELMDAVRGEFNDAPIKHLLY